ncbi:MAG TPA: hypothetical protein ENJ82_01085 [Bacteroidetes bacterium]|nr:hypothetical protein [Bacteroidota bacterium]
MGQLSVAGVETWTTQRILGFFNRAFDSKDLIEGVLKDDPGTGTGKYVIGEVVAQRIIDRRNALPGQQYSSLTQLNGIQGMGVDKFHDLVYTFRLPAAEAFKEAMYTNVISANWKLESHTSRWNDQQEFLDLVDNPSLFQNWLATEIGRIAKVKFDLRFSAADACSRLEASHQIVYDSGHLAAFAFAFWFYRFDLDNWFQYEQVVQETNLYLDFMPNVLDRTELRLFVGFENQNLLAEPATVKDLPVVVNYGEQAVTIWAAQLND